MRSQKVNVSLEAALAQIERARSVLSNLQTTLEDALKLDDCAGYKPGSASDSPRLSNSHVREHRPGRPSKIDNDPDLRAFILARIDHMTFDGLAKAVAENFPPERRVARSTINDWWHRQFKRR